MAQGAEEEVRVLKGSLEAAEASKATAETQLQAAKSENRDILVRTTGCCRIFRCASSTRMLPVCDDAGFVLCRVGTT